MIKVIVLGTAQDGGVPQAGCRQPYCERARRDPSFARAVASLAVIDTTARRTFLVDATPDARNQIDYLLHHPDYPPRPDRNPVDGVILTHAHIGHYAGLVQFGNEVMATSRMPVYCTRSMAAFLRENGPWAQLVRDDFLSLHASDAPAELRLTDRLLVRTFLVPHRQEWSDTIALEIRGETRRLLYMPDIDHWDQWQEDVQQIVRQGDIALLDGCFYSGDELPGRDMDKVPHPLISDTMARLAALAASRCIVFTHLNHTNPVQEAESPQRRAVEAAGFHVAAERQEFVL